MTFGEHRDGIPGQCDEATAHAIMDRFAEVGGNFIDTADIYQYGVSEEYVGSWLSMKEREKFVIATKVCAPMDPTYKDPNQLGLSRHHIMDSIDKSLKRLQTDYVDLYQIHRWDDATPIEETMRALDDLVRAGKVRYIGASNVTGWQLQKIWRSGRAFEMGRPGFNPELYPGHVQDMCTNVVSLGKTLSTTFLTPPRCEWRWLTGKFRCDMTAAPADTRVGWASEKEGRKSQAAPDYQQYAHSEKFWALDKVLKCVAKEQGKSVAQVSLRWLLQKDVVSSVIIGAKTLQQLEDNMGAAAGWELTQQQCSANRPSPMGPGLLDLFDYEPGDPGVNGYLTSCLDMRPDVVPLGKALYTTFLTPPRCEWVPDFEGSVPDEWKNAIVVPIPKTTPPSVEEVRPISLTSLLAKVAESFITTWAVSDILLESTTNNSDVLKEGLRPTLGLRASLTRWRADFLTNRRQAVRYHGVVSDNITVTCGLPQGTLLGPLIFITYINSAASHAISQRWKFVDDLNMLEIRYPPTAPSYLQQDLSDLDKWSQESHMLLHPGKLKHFQLSTDDLVTVYISYIRPGTEYAAAVWHSGLPVVLSKRIEKVQKRALRIILGTHYKSYKRACDQLGLPSLWSRREKLTKDFAKSLVQSTPYRHLLPPSRGNISSRVTRTSHKLDTQPCRTARYS
ncbi:hypothetical protein Bbelb_385930 [Branchiostoma belcheri]|nr:hypothetical protein Bbelb_385930 [Branchiostoma belcheri]